MLSLSVLAWSTAIFALVALWWQSDKIKLRALQHVHQHCRQLKLQLLDQTMVLRGLWPVRDSLGSLRLRRRYEFEFSVTGEKRYHGTVILIGHTISSIDLDPHTLPQQENTLH